MHDDGIRLVSSGARHFRPAILAMAIIVAAVTAQEATAQGAQMPLVEELAAKEEIAQVKARYFRCIDTKDWVCWNALFTSDAELDFRLGAGLPARGDEWVFKGAATIRAVPEKFKFTDPHHLTVHHGFMPEIKITSPITATAIWAMEDSVIDGYRRLEGKGYYFDEYRKVDGRWLISKQRLERLRRTVTQTNGATIP